MVKTLRTDTAQKQVHQRLAGREEAPIATGHWSRGTLTDP